MALGSNNFQGSITFNVDQAISQIDALQQKIDKWTSALNNPNYSPAVINSLEKEIERANISLAQLQQTTIDTGNALENNFNVPAMGSFRAMTSLDRVTREFASGSMQSGMNGLVGFGNAMSRMAMQAGSVEGAFQGIASTLMGPMGIILAMSALIGIFESYQKEVQKVEQEQEKLRNGVSGEVSKVEVLVARYNQSNISLEERKAIISKLNNESPQYFGNLDKEHTSVKEINAAYDEYLSNIQNVLTARILEAKLSEMISARLKYEKENGIELLKSGYRNPEYLKEAQKKLDKDKELLAAEKSMANDLAKLTPTKGKEETHKNSERQDNSTLQLLKEQQKAYKDDIYQFENYADQIANEEERLDIIKAKQNKASTKEIENIHSLYEQKRLNNMKVLGDEIAKEQEKQAKEEEKREKEEVQVLEDIQIEAAKDNISRIEDDLKVQEKIANKDFEQKKIAIKKAMADITASMGGVENTKAVDMYTKSLSNLDKELKIVEADERNNDIKKQEEYYKKFAKTLATDVTNGLMTMWDAMQKGENPLKAIGDMLMKMVEQLAQAVIQAVLLQTIMSAFGMGSVETGGFGSIGGAIKSVFGFADGGVVSQPTLMMAGEGGQSEAIMPLNKLGNMMNNTFSAGASSGLGQGSGGGQFTLKGNDLVLALQRSNYSLNLRRGS